MEPRRPYSQPSGLIDESLPVIQTRRTALSDSVDAVAAVLAGYAERRVFHGFGRGPAASAKASFQIAWHRGRVFELTFDARTGTLRLPELLCDVPADSTMYDELKAFIRDTADKVEHEVQEAIDFADQSRPPAMADLYKYMYATEVPNTISDAEQAMFKARLDAEGKR